MAGSWLHRDLGTEASIPAYNPLHDGTRQGYGFGYFATNLSDSLRLSVMAGTSYNRFDIPNTPGQPADPVFEAEAGVTAPASANFNQQQFERNDFGILALQGLLPQGGIWQLTAFNRVSSVLYEPDPNGGDLLYGGVAARIKRKATAYGLQGDMSIPIGERHTLRVGFFTTLSNLRSDNTPMVFPTAPANPDGSCPTGSAASPSTGYCVSGTPTTIIDNNPKNGNNLEAVYVQDQWDVSDNVTLNYGLRYDMLNAYVSATQLSPRLGMIWYIDPRTTFHAGYARYFAPPPEELVSTQTISKFANTTNAPAVTTNGQVKPECSDYFDVGLSRQVTDAWNAGLDSYYKYSHDLIDEGQFGQALIYLPFNYAQGHVYGIELTNAFHRGNWNAYLNVAYSIAKGTQIESGQSSFSQDDLNYIASHYIYLDHTQRWTASGGVSYTWHRTTYSIGGLFEDGLRNSDGGIPNGGKQPPWAIVNLGVAHRFLLGTAGPLTVRLTVLNLLDRSYQIHDGSSVGVFAPQYGPRRGVYLGLEKRI